jgi:virE domain protein
MSFKKIDTNDFITAAREYKVFEGYKCGVGGLDKIFRIDKQTLTTLVAMPGSGKSTFTNFYGYRMAKNNEWKTLYIAEETPKARQCRLLSVLFNGKADKASKYSVMYDYDLSDWQELLNMIKDAKDTYGVDMVILDNFSTLSKLIKNVNESANVGIALSALKKAAIETNTAIILVSHPTKINEGQKVTAYSVSGSANFFNLSDFMFTLTADKYAKETTIEVLKVRDDTKGVTGGECTLKYDAVHLKYSDTDSSTEDSDTDSQPAPQVAANNTTAPKGINYTIARDVMKAIMEEEGAKQEDSQPAQAGIQTAIPAPTQPAQATPTATQQTAVQPASKEVKKAKQHITPDFLIKTKVSIMRGHKVLNESDLYNAIITGRICKEKIAKVRSIDRQANESEYKQAKEKVLSFTPSCVCAGTTAKEIKQVNPLIAIDLDAKDNEGVTLETMRTKINSLPFVMYSSLSVGGRGMYALIPILESNKNDFKGVFKALESDFKALGLTLDSSCINVNRERYMSFDDNEYWNKQCEIYTRKINIPTQVNGHPTRVEINANKPLTQREYNKVKSMVEDIKANKVQLSKNHDDTLKIANAIANIWGEEGRTLLHLIRSQRSGYDEYKTDCKFDYVLDHLDDKERYGLGFIFSKYKEAKGQTQAH